MVHAVIVQICWLPAGIDRTRPEFFSKFFIFCPALIQSKLAKVDNRTKVKPGQPGVDDGKGSITI